MSAEPVAGVVLSADGQPTLVVRGNEDMHLWSLGAQRLFTRATLDAAVAAARAEERERCETLARYALDAATEGNWAYAAVLLQRIKGEPSGSDAAAIRDLKPE